MLLVLTRNFAHQRTLAGLMTKQAWWWLLLNKASDPTAEHEKLYLWERLRSIKGLLEGLRVPIQGAEGKGNEGATDGRESKTETSVPALPAVPTRQLVERAPCE